MNAKKIILMVVIVIGALVLAGVGWIGWLVTAGLRTPARVGAPDYWPTDGWRVSAPEAQGFDSAKMAAGVQALQDNQVDIDSLLIVRNGYVVLDATFAPYDGSFPHDMASVTKSVMTTLIGIAIDQGRLDLNQPVVSFFPEREIANLDAWKEQMTVRDLVSMRNGMQSGCHEADAPTLETMQSNPDWVGAAMDRPMVAEPGTTFCYDSPGMHLLSAILQQASGMTAFEFARQYLFEPLGIRDVLWESDPQGYSRGWGDLHLLPEDMAKIGLLWLQRGQWDGRQVVSETWVLDSVRAYSKNIEPDYGYGYGWWVAWSDYQASGRGGQRIRVIASRNTLVVVTGGDADYGQIESWLIPMLVLPKKSLPANPDGVAALETALANAAQEEAVWRAGYMPDTASQVSGATYACESNPAGLEQAWMEFAESDQATLLVRMGGIDWVWPVGLDGQYRLAPDGTGFRGYWADEQSFHIEAFDIGILTRQVVLVGDEMQVNLPEVGVTVICRVENQE